MSSVIGGTLLLHKRMYSTSQQRVDVTILHIRGTNCIFRRKFDGQMLFTSIIHTDKRPVRRKRTQPTCLLVLTLMPLIFPLVHGATIRFHNICDEDMILWDGQSKVVIETHDSTISILPDGTIKAYRHGVGNEATRMYGFVTDYIQTYNH